MYARNCATDEDNTNNQEETLQTNNLRALTSLQLLFSSVFTCFRFAATLNMLLCLSLCIRVITSLVVNVPTLLAVGAHRLTFPFVHDFTNGYFQGQEIDRILRYRSPAEGIPEEGVAGGSILASRVPICGAKDAGRGLWLRLNNTCKQFKFSLDRILPTLFTLRNHESKIIAVLSSNVDDLLYGYLLEGADAIQFLVGKEEDSTFRFCGKEFQQDEDFGIHVTTENHLRREIWFDTKGYRKRITQLRSVTQSLAWIARQTRPDLSYRISKIQSTFENACVRDLRECKRIVEYAISTPTRAFTFLQLSLGMMQLL